MKKFISAVTSVCMAASMVSAIAPISVSAEDASKTVSITTFGDSKSTISKEEIAAGDVTVKCAAYLSEETADTNSMVLTFYLSEKSADTSAVSFNTYSIGSNYYDTAQTYTSASGIEFSTALPVFFAGTVASVRGKGSYSPEGGGSYFLIATDDRKEFGCDTPIIGLAWSKSNDNPYTWVGSKSDDYPIAYFDVVFAKDAAPGEYIIDYFNYYTDGSTHLQPSNAINAGESNKYAAIGDFEKLNLEPLTITIEGDSTPATTTAAPATTTAAPVTTTTAAPATTTAAPATTTAAPTTTDKPSADGITIDFGTYKAKPGDTIEANAKITANGNRIAAMEGMYVIDSPLKISQMYAQSPAFNNLSMTATLSELSFAGTFMDDKLGMIAIDGEDFLMFDIDVPANCPAGDYEVTLKDFRMWEDDNKGAIYSNVSVIKGIITIEGEADAGTTTTPAATTTTPAATTTTPAATTTTTTKPGSVVYGDANCDGIVTIADVVVLNKHLSNSTLYGLSEQGKINAEVDLNNDLNFTDSQYIIQSIVHLVTLPITD